MKTELLWLRAAEVARLSDARRPFSSLFATSLHTLAKRQIGAVRILARDLRLAARIRTARDVRHVVGLSLFVMADRIVERIGRYYAQASLANLESGQARYRYNRDGSRRRRFVMPPEVAQVYEDSLKEYIDDVTNGLVRVQVRRRTVAWKVTLQARCCMCGEWYTPTRGYQARCGKCARRSSSSKGRRMRRPYPNGDDSRTTVHGNDLVVIPDNGNALGNGTRAKTTAVKASRSKSGEKDVQSNKARPDKGASAGKGSCSKPSAKGSQSNKARVDKDAGASKGSASTPASRRGSISSSKASNKKIGKK